MTIKPKFAENKKNDNILPAVYYNPPFELGFLHPRYAGIWLLIVLLAVCAILPRRLARGVGAGAGDLFYKFNKKRRHIAQVNIKMCFPALDENERYKLLRAHYRDYGQNIIDMGLMWWSPYTRLQNMTYIRGINYFMNLANREKNIILLAPHAAGIDFTGIYLSKMFPGITMMKALKNPVLDWFVTKGRSRFGCKILLREMGLKPMVRAIRQNVIAYYVPDEDFGPELSVNVPFFGVPSATLPTLGRMAKMTKAKVVPVMTRFLPEGKGYEINFLEPLENYPSGDEIEDASRMNNALEELIKIAPQQYMWTLKWFKTRPNNQPNPYKY